MWARFGAPDCLFRARWAAVSCCARHSHTAKFDPGLELSDQVWSRLGTKRASQVLIAIWREKRAQEFGFVNKFTFVSRFE
jgi:hypothetical protein